MAWENMLIISELKLEQTIEKVKIETITSFIRHERNSLYYFRQFQSFCLVLCVFIFFFSGVNSNIYYDPTIVALATMLILCATQSFILYIEHIKKWNRFESNVVGKVHNISVQFSTIYMNTTGIYILTEPET